MRTVIGPVISVLVASLGEIECALPALSGMAVDFHEGGPGLAQSRIDNFRVEVCTSSP